MLGAIIMKQKKTSGMSFRLCATLLALALVLGCGIGGTLAWLTAQTDPVVNTFTVGDINIELWEYKYIPETNKLDEYTWVTSNTYKILPGSVLPKDPFILMKEGSEPCWLFMKMEKKNFVEGINHSNAWARYWNKLESEDDVYYIEYTPENDAVALFFDNNGIAEEQEIHFFGKQLQAITVSGDLTKEDMAEINAKGGMELNFTAYAVQRYGFETAADAWAVIKSTYPDQFPSGSED